MREEEDAIVPCVDARLHPPAPSSSAVQIILVPFYDGPHAHAWSDVVGSEWLRAQRLSCFVCRIIPIVPIELNFNEISELIFQFALDNNCRL